MKNIPIFAAAMTFALAFLPASQVLSQTNPVNIGWAVRANVTSQGVAVSSNFLYVADYRDGLSIWDISSKTNPILLGHTATNYGGYARRVVVAGSYAYVANDTDGLRIYDVSTPSNPTNVGHINDLYKPDGSPAYNGADAYDLVVQGNYVYLANGFDGLRIYDVSNPVAPVHVGHKVFNNGGQWACGIAVSGRYAFLADYVGLSAYDISDLSNPLFLGTTYCNSNGGIALSVFVSGNYAYVADKGEGLQIFDISNPAAASIVGHINNGGTTNGTIAAAHVIVRGNYAYLANNTDGMRIYDVSNPANPVNVGLATNVFGAYSKHIAISGSYAFVANSFDGVRIDFLGIPASPSLRIARTSNSITLSWPAPTAAFEVEESSDFNLSNWVTLTNVPAVVGSRNQISVPATTGNRFYRLKSM
jgi:hypothetical protein